MAIGLAMTASRPTRGAAQATQTFTTKPGVQFSLPASMRPRPVPAALGDSGHVVEQVFADDGASPLQLFVVSSPRRPDHVLPPNTEQVRRDFANGFVAGARPLLKTFELQNVTPGNYDPTRGAFALQLSASGPSPAHRMLSEMDDGPVWAQVRTSGEDATLLRCFMTQLLGGANFVDEAKLRANSKPAAQRCGVPVQRIERFLANVDRAAFGPTAISLTAVAIFTRSATVSFYALAASERKQAVAALATLLWSTASVPVEARLASSDDPLSSPLTSGRMIGIVIGSFVAMLTLGGALAWSLFKWLHLSARTAVGAAFLALNALALLGLVLSREGTSVRHWMQLAGYVLSAAVLYRPITKWVAARQRAPAPEPPSADPQP
jgi:hypothetical protein